MKRMTRNELYKTFYEVHWIDGEDEVKFKEFDTLKQAEAFEKKMKAKGFETILQSV
jgi:hypothetical protein